MKAVWMISASLLSAAIAHPASAQDAPTPVSSDNGAQRVQGGEPALSDGEIIVTATRRSERLRDVPLSITAFSQAKLSSEGIVGYEGLARETPGVVVNKPTANFNNFTARGIATNGYGANLQSTVAIYIDELPISRTGNTTLLDPNLYDVERVEFLRGPQGTLFGSGSLAGALRILTKSPDLDGFDSSALVDIGLTGSDSVRQRYNAMVNVPLIDGALGLRAVGFYRNEEGYVDNVETGIHNANTLKNYGGRLILLAKPTERLSLRLLASYEKSLPKDSALINPTLGRFARRSARPDIFSGEQQNYNATLEYQFDGALLTSSSTYSHFKQEFSADISAAVGRAIPYALNAEGPEKSFVQETRLASDPGGRFDWVVGVFYFYRSTQLENRLLSTAQFLADRGITGGQGPDGDLIGTQVLRLKTHELAGFGELTYHFSDRFWATGGIRYGRTDSQLRNFGGFNTDYITRGLTGGTGALAIADVAPNVQPKVVGKRPSFKGSLSYRLSDDVTTYALVSTGYRAPVQNASAGRVSLIDPTDIVIPNGAGSDKLINYEAGLKGSFFGGAVTGNFALYWIDWKDIQVQANRVSDSAQFATNIGSARSRGLEFEVTARPVPGLSFGVNGSVGGTKITRLTPSEAAISGAVPGARLSAPNFQSSFFAQADFDLSERLSGYVNMTLQHVGSFPNMFQNVPGRPGTVAPTYGYTDDYENINLRLGLRSGNLSAAFYVENLLNDDSTTYLHPEGYLDARYGTLRPRTFGIRLGYNL
ncbi:TonB-dependent receptor [Sphingopyxis sp. 113P3]|uniref:TonB-dependent receptor n=1 Tax=Sphingopyxis sp. (strain 113P3) TaxID=292913 RepID=UPI0006AD229C|nr:TonB-dependent receptor [Sphingopyxis sp. 113P3]ALC11162.1 TonB-dependent receptor [Sphingopyxis sp. 113P3]